MDNIKEAAPYCEVFDRTNHLLFQCYSFIVSLGDWCKVRPGLMEQRDDNEGEGHNVIVIDDNDKKDVMLPLRAKPAPRPLPKKAMPQKRVQADVASGPPSPDITDDDHPPPPPPKKLPPPLPRVTVPAQGVFRPPLQPTAKKMPPPVPNLETKMDVEAAPSPQFGGKAPAPRFGGPREPPYPPPDWKGPFQPPNFGPREPPYPPPDRVSTQPKAGSSSALPADVHPAKPHSSAPAPRTNRWSRTKEENSAENEKGIASEKEGIASEKEGIASETDMKSEMSVKVEEISRIPLPEKKDEERHAEYVKYVKNVVLRWLTNSEDDMKKKNPNYKRNSLTNFLVMTLCTSFLEAVRDAGRTMYKDLHGHREDYYEDTNWLIIDLLNLKKWSAHGRTGHLWNYMSESLGVQNFCPDDPTDMDQWQQWLTNEQVFKTMEYLFKWSWNAWPDRRNKFATTMSLWTHYDVLWAYYKHLVVMQLVNEGVQEPYPEEWTWEGWLDLQRVKYVEKAVICFRSRLGSAESLAKMHTESFADRMLALANGDDEHGIAPKAEQASGSEAKA